MELKIDAEEKNAGAEIAAALERILSQPDFLASPRLSSFLRFVVTETLEGRADRLKAFTIASMALGHDEKFNPKTNSIVRVQAGRLRHLLEYYYRGPGRFDRCEIRLPRGSYAPEFLFRSGRTTWLPQPPASAPDIRAGPSGRAGDPPPFDTSKRFGRPSRGLVFAAASWSWRGRSGSAHRSGVAALPSRSSPADTPLLRSRADGPARARRSPSIPSKESGTILPCAHLPACWRTGSKMRSAASTIPWSCIEAPLRRHLPIWTISLSGRVTQAAGGNISLAFRIWHPASGEIIWSRTFDGLHLENTEAALEPTVGALTSAVAQTYGVVFTDMRKRLSGEPEGFGCVILASDYFKMPSAAAHAAARDCLERTLAQHPNFAPGFAALSYLMVDTYLNGVDARPGEKPLDVAIEMANRAVDLAPQKARAHTALFLTRFFDKQFEDAFASAEQALQLNPYATDDAARIGFAHVLRGEFDDGIELLRARGAFQPFDARMV